MRTKQTTGKKKATNGLNTPSATPDMVRSPAAPQELSEADRARLRAFLNKSDKPFSIETIPATRKRKRGSADPHTEPNLDDERLTVQYEVKPASNWESLRKYKKFTVGDESIGAGEHVLVKHDDTDDGKVDYAAQWKAKVLEVRALDSEHVYVRVAWLNRPEDLDTGRKSYHGKNELIPTNQLDIIDAMTVNGKLDVYKWEEENDDSTMPDPEEYFWRQSYDFANTRTFSKLRPICRDETPQNPDETIVQCGSSKCRRWMHAKCLAEDALERASQAQEPSGKKRKSVGYGKRKSNTQDRAMSETATSMAITPDGTLTAEVFVAELPVENPAEKTEIVITEADGKKRSEELRCLLCGEVVE